MPIPFTKAWREKRALSDERAAKVEAERKAAKQARNHEQVKSNAREAEDRFKAIGATFTGWCEVGRSTVDSPVIQAYFRFADQSGGHTVKRV